MSSSPSCESKWQTSPIGGELRPEVQAVIFTENPWGASHEKWDDCVKVSHPTWLINEKIKSYSGDTKANAIKAQKQMGYDFQVVKAYFDNIKKSSSLFLGIDVKNIGIAPFYYNHTLWPVMIGVKDAKVTVVASWKTTWDLNTIPADASSKNFEFTQDKPNLDPGKYTVAIKVVNPLPNGHNLKFANKNQKTDGWLDLGTFTVVADNAVLTQDQPDLDTPPAPWQMTDIDTPLPGRQGRLQQR